MLACGLILLVTKGKLLIMVVKTL